MDWPKLIADLSAANISQQTIAMRAGVTQPTVSALANGETKSPGWKLGQTVLGLHRKHCGKRKAA